MSDRLAELTERQRALQQRCAAQRNAIAQQVSAFESRFESVDRVARLARSTLLNPGVIVAVVAGLLTLGRARGLRLVGRAMLLSAAARRLIRFARHL